MKQTRITDELYHAPLQGLNLQPGGLAEQLSDEPTLLVFLRHFG